MEDFEDFSENPRLLEHLIQSEISNFPDGKVITCAKFDEKYRNSVENRLEEDFPEHIIGCKLMENQREKKILTVTSRNTLTIRKSSNLKIESKIQCDYYATSICSLITGNSPENCHVYFGSVIGELIDWRPKKEEKPVKRVGHKGMIFSIVTDSTRIFTISDDRTIRMWSIFDRNSGPICTVFGHTARPFSICVDPARHLIYTGGIEQTLFTWKYDETEIQLLRKTPISCGVIRKISKIDEKTLAISSQNGDLLEIRVDSQEKNLEILAENILNFGFLHGKLAILTGKNELIVFESDFMEKIVFRCSEMRHMTSSEDSVVVWNGDTFIVILEKNVHRLKLSLNIISATCHKNWVLLKTIDGFLQLYTFQDSKNIHCLGKFRPKNQSIIPSKFTIIQNILVVGTTHGELYHADLAEKSGNLHQSFTKNRIFPMFSGKEVTFIREIPEISAFMTLGKTGIWSTFRLTRGTGNTVEMELLSSRSFSTSSQMAWPSKFIDFDKELLIAGFYGISLIIWNSTKGVPMYETYCGGGHREWQLNQIKTESIFHFDFIRDGDLCRKIVNLSEKKYLKNTAHSSPIVAGSGSQNYLITVSLDGHLSVSDNQGNSIITMFVGENLLCTDIHENEQTGEVFVMAGGGKSKFSIIRFTPSELQKHGVFWLRQVTRPDEGRIVDVKICNFHGKSPIFCVSYSSGALESLKIAENGGIEKLDQVELEDSLGIGAKIDFFEGKLMVGTTGSHFLTFNLTEKGKFEEISRLKLSDRSGVTSLKISDFSNSTIIGLDSGNIFQIQNLENSQKIEKIHSHLSTVVGIAVFSGKIHSVSLDCAILTNLEQNVSRKSTIVDMPNGMVSTGKSKLAVFGDGIQILDANSLI